eukprot:2777458-Rhodomonas_salina.1
MGEAAMQAAGAGGDALGTLLQRSVNAVEDHKVSQAFDSGAGSSKEEEPAFVQLVGGEGSD